MFDRNRAERILIKKIDKLNKNLESENISKLFELVGNSKKLYFKNFISGIIKGIGISIGFSILSAIIVYILQKIIRLNIPIISEYIVDVVDIVEKNR